MSIRSELGRKNGNGKNGRRRYHRGGRVGKPVVNPKRDTRFKPGHPGNPDAKGREPKLKNQNLRVKFLECISLGLPVKQTANIIGVAVGTIKDWFRYSEMQYDKWYVDWEESGFLTDVEIPFWVSIYLDIKEAESKGEQEALGAVRKAAVGQLSTTEQHDFFDSKGAKTSSKTVNKTARPVWQAAAWLLERRFPERYAKDRTTGDLPAGLDRETIMLAQVLKTIPLADLEEIKVLIRQKMRPNAIDQQTD